MAPFRVPVDVPLLRPLPSNLLAVADIVPEGDDRWTAGLSVREWPRLADDGWVTFDACVGATKKHSRPGPHGDAPAFGIAAGLTCTAAGVVDDKAFRERAQRVFEAYEPRLVETEVATSSVGSDYDLASAPSLGTTASVLDAVAQLSGVRSTLGLLHMHPMIAELAQAAFVIRPDARGRLISAAGHQVVTGGGYPDDELFITAPMVVRRSAILLVPDNFAQALNRAANDVTFYVERQYLVAWDRSEDARISLS